jgi:phosphatidylserine decarboxylase
VIKFATQYAKAHVAAFAIAFICDIVTLIGVTAFIYFTVNSKTALIFGLVYGVLAVPLPAFLLLFFRDPDRKADRETIPANVMLAPSDGTVTDVTRVDDPRVGGPAIKVSVFMSVFNVHVNRVPCEAKVTNVEVKPGEYLDARNLEASRRNKCCDMTLEVIPQAGVDLPKTMVVRQIAGLVAKQIICDAPIGETFKPGQRFGMVRFGSRTELIVPANPEPTILVKPGQKVQTGETVLLKYS